MPIYQYYAVIEKDTEGYSVTFPDVDGCFTCGSTLSEAVSMAEEAFGFHLISTLEDIGQTLPPASPLKQIQAPEGASVVLVRVNTDSYKET